MCILREKKNVLKGEKQQQYGILLHNMRTDSTLYMWHLHHGRWSLSDTCFKLVVTLLQKDQGRSVQSNKRQSYGLSSVVPTSNRTQKDFGYEAAGLREGVQCATDCSSFPKRQTAALDISTGTFVTMYFRWEELDDKTGNLGVTIPGEPGDKLGEHRTGKVIGKRQNQKKRWVYDCQFEGTIPPILGFFTPDLRRGRATYEKWAKGSASEASAVDNNDTSSDKFEPSPERLHPTSTVAPVLGTKLCQWFMACDLHPNVPTNGGGSWIDGEVVGVQTSAKGDAEFKTKFATPHDETEMVSAEAVSRMAFNYRIHFVGQGLSNHPKLSDAKTRGASRNRCITSAFIPGTQSNVSETSKDITAIGTSATSSTTHTAKPASRVHADHVSDTSSKDDKSDATSVDATSSEDDSSDVVEAQTPPRTEVDAPANGPDTHAIQPVLDIAAKTVLLAGLSDDMAPQNQKIATVETGHEPAENVDDTSLASSSTRDENSEMPTDGTRPA